SGPWPNWLIDTVYQPLIGVNQSAQFSSGAIQYTPALTKNWTVSPDGATYTLNLRNDVKFSSGNPFNAYQVWMELYGFYYLSGNSSAWLESYSLFDMSNVNFGPATIALINQSGLVIPSQQALGIMDNTSWPVYATGPYSIVFHLHAPFSYFLGTLVAYEGLMFDSQWVLTHGGFGTPTQFNTGFNQNPIPGSGPYVVTHVAENSYVQFAQDSNYWGKNLTQGDLNVVPIFDPGHAKNVIINYKPDDLARYTDLSSGASQVSIVESADWNLVQSNPTSLAYFTMPSWNGEMAAVSINSLAYPTNITLVRQAIVHGINYTDIAQKVFFGQIAPVVGPEYPAWKQFYDLGNFTPYSYNSTLAQADLKQANIQNFPTLNFTVITGCQFCINTAEIVQTDLSQIGITVNIEVQSTSNYYAPYSSYSVMAGNAQAIGSLSMLGAEEWGPGTLTPADYWFTFVSNESLYGNWAVYSSPAAVACANAFTSTTNVTFIQSSCKTAQQQIYNDAPYAWLGLDTLWYAAGSLVWQKSVVSGFLVDPVWDGQSTAPIFNTLKFVS
ncbi:MAG: ABC transporter substrate-binding protein, partial [Candidatus Bathyarchaeia archaeon]